MEEKYIGKKRKPTPDELRLIRYLANKANYKLDENFREDLYVAPITYDSPITKDEISPLKRIYNTLFRKQTIISSLKLIYDTPIESNGKVITECQFPDQDDVTVSAVLRINRENHLDELAIWKTDNSQISRIPPCEQMTYIPVGDKRKPTSDEIRLIKYLANKANYELAPTFDEDICVIPLSDEDIAPIEIKYNNVPNDIKTSGKIIASCQFPDTDDIPIWVDLWAYDENLLKELDLWKGDFSTITTIPPCDQMSDVPQAQETLGE
jgi:hypothetical protein